MTKQLNLYTCWNWCSKCTRTQALRQRCTRRPRSTGESVPTRRSDAFLVHPRQQFWMDKLALTSSTLQNQIGPATENGGQRGDYSKQRDPQQRKPFSAQQQCEQVASQSRLGRLSGEIGDHSKPKSGLKSLFLSSGTASK